MNLFREWLRESEIYYSVNLPIQEKDLNVLYEHYNKKIFKSTLPNIRLKITTLAKNFYGKAHVKYEMGDKIKIKDLLITMNSKIVNNKELFINTLIHEMIHIKQYIMNEKENTFKYSEASWGEIFAHSGNKDKNYYGHNAYFIDEMQKINKLGYNITIEGDAPIGTELSNDIYGICFYNSVDSSILVWHPNDVTNKIEEIIESIQERKGNTYTNYLIFKTKESNLTLATRLTKDYKLPKNVINIEFSKKWVQDIIETGKIILDKTIETKMDKGNIRNELISIMPHTAKYRNTDLDSYFKTVYFNAFPEWKIIKTSELFSNGKMFEGIKIPNDLNDDECKIIFDFWKDISDSEIKKASSIKWFYTDFKYSKLMKKPLINGIDKLYNDYKENYEKRCSVDKFKKIVFEFIKKTEKTENIDVIYKELTKNTFLEIL